MRQTSGAARMESQMHSVQWPTVTRPADNTDALLLLSAPRMCVCGHPVCDEEPRCPLCACQVHKPRLPATGDHSAPAAVPPDSGEAGRRLRPELPRAVPCCLGATARCRPEPVPANAPRQRHPATAARGPRSWAVPGAHSPRAGATAPAPGNPADPGHPARLWPPSPQFAGHANIRRTLLPSSTEPPNIAPSWYGRKYPAD
jgi:hypothetical protein